MSKSYAYQNISFNFARIPNIIFGQGKLTSLYSTIQKFGKQTLLVTGKSSLHKSGKLNEILKEFSNNGIKSEHVIISGEPSPQMIDEIVKKYFDSGIEVVVSIGGGSVLDAGKAISAMILYNEPIKEFLEGVGTKKHDGRKIPFIAIPTTSGTGSEATKNAVISQVGPDGFKKSLRHDNLVPDYAIIDPELMISTPSDLTAACGMDAFTQLLESYVSTKSSPMTDSLARTGLKLMIDNLVLAVTTKQNDIDVRAAVAYATLISGMTLANAGLGTIHGFASAVGGYFSIPHGIVCGTLMAEGNKITIELLKKSPNSIEKRIALKKYAEIGAMINNECLPDDCDDDKINYYCDLLIIKLEKLTEDLRLKKFGDYGVTEADIDKILSKAGNKNNPIALSKEDMKKLIRNRI